ncbi:class I SAM-dependent methyltransferase [Legionella sp. CNM-4043-24]|uniref:class I SAM-dependent methyltransferase n=1 Tax=Legionella sp. CNM-4043-24 TaxID=3421646 RepID=UPI00403AA365
MTEISESDIKAGQAVYTGFILKIYDLWVLGISNRWIWRCPSRYLQEQFDSFASVNHLDIGVGTGHYLKHHTWPQRTRLALMDLNPGCLEAAKNAVRPLPAETYEADIFKQQPASLNEQFDSISINYLLHCLPGNMIEKSIAIKHAVAMLKPGGLLFGATILADENLQSGMSRRLMAFYNEKRIFSNQHDDRQSLQMALEKNLERVEITVRGCVALFIGYKTGSKD